MAVKRLLISAVLALGVHAILLGTEFGRLRHIPSAQPKPGALTISLALQHTPKLPKTVVKKKPDMPLKRPDRLKPPAPKPKKPPQELKPQTVQAKIKEMPTIVHPKPPAAESEIENSHEALEMTEPNAENVSTAHIIRKVRPIYRINPRPKYPRVARARGYQGNVVLEVLVDREGKVSDLRVFNSSGYSILDKAAKETVKNWLFEPGLVGNEKIEMWVRIPIRFELE